jgi:hypothetical protein
MAARKSNPFAEKQRKLPYRALMRRQGPWRREDQEEIAAACERIANGGDYLTWAGSRGQENGCTVIAFDTPEKAAEMQAWIDTSGIADRPLPESVPNLPQLRFGRM